MGHRSAQGADFDLEGIWFYFASRTGSIEKADRFIDSITNRFSLLASHPYMGRARDADLRVGLRTFPVGDYVMVYRIEDGDVMTLRVVRGSRDLQTLL